LQRALEALSRSAMAPDHVTTCAIFASPMARGQVDLAGPTIESPQLFEWNFVNHVILQQSCVDMDGLLCFDPPPEIDDDGPRYIEFLAAARPRHRLQKKVKAIVSARLSRYRGPTEEWLRRHGIEYEQLHLLDAPSAAERRRRGLQATFKAAVYRASGAVCFFESELGQAQRIASLTGMSVVCTDTMRLMTPYPSIGSPYWIRRVGKPIARRLRLATD
jgi:uncharacterized HAD superfamily protein